MTVSFKTKLLGRMIVSLELAGILFWVVRFIKISVVYESSFEPVC